MSKLTPKHTKYGFILGNLEVECLSTPNPGEKIRRFIRLTTPREKLDIGITPSGLIRLYDGPQKVHTTKKNFVSLFAEMLSRYEKVIFSTEKDAAARRSMILQEMIDLILEVGCPILVVDKAVDILQESYVYMSDSQKLAIASVIDKSLERREDMEQTLEDFRAKHAIFLDKLKKEKIYVY